MSGEKWISVKALRFADRSYGVYISECIFVNRAMKATAKDLRTDTKRILDAVERGQEVIVTVRGKPRARIVALRTAKRAKRATGSAALFGIWKDRPDTRDVAAYVNRLRSGRF